MNESIPFADLRVQNRSLAPEIMQAIEEVVLNCNFILGEPVRTFEEAFARFIGTRHAIGVSTGLSGLRLCLEALNIGQGDEVIVPANTFIATALAVTQTKATLKLADCDPGTLEMDPALVAAACTARTKAILPVHLYGQTPDMDAIMSLAHTKGLLVIEDAAQAHGASYRGKGCGSMGIASAFSFYPAKNLGCLGDGGIVTTNDERVSERIRCLRNYGQREKYNHLEKGGNDRLDTLQAAVLSIKLQHLADWNQSRARHAALYRERLQGVGDLQFQEPTPGSTHVYHLMVVQTDQRDALRDHLEKQGIETGIHYPTPVHLQKAYADLGYHEGDFPVAERASKRILSLPMFAEMTEPQLQRVTDAVRKFFAG